ncbi:MAG TPA: ABC transporter ATP-binding protein [Thermodesulfobacteriota bacterium]
MAIAIAHRTEEKIQGAPVRVVRLEKAYGPVRAVDGVSIDVRAGEFLALLGPSGSGKTTILMTIAGFEQPTAGAVYIGDRPVTHVPPNRRNVGMVFQKYALFPHMTVWDNIAFPLRMRKVPAREIAERVERALDLVRLAGYGSRKPGQLSGGQQQRVALARAIVYRPPVLLMDEPLGALDKKLREQMQLEVKHLQQSLGATVIYVTHDQDEALTMADRIAVLNEGRLEQIGPPEELYERPANSFVADFIGETNFLTGRVDTPTGGACTVLLDGGPVVSGIWAGPDAEPAIGTPVKVAVRPERIVLRRADERGPQGYAGVIEETVYAGNSLVCMVRLGPGLQVTARVPSGSGQRRWRVGDRVGAAWRVEDARVYPNVGR